MTKADVHICLVSDQLLPNLLPVLDVLTKPVEVVLLVTARMTLAAERLKGLLREAGCRVDQRTIEAFRIEDIRALVLGLVEEYDGRSLALNATGGTKVMALGATGIFQELGLPVFYIDTENRALISLSTPQMTRPLPDLLKVDTCLKCYGYRVMSTLAPELQPQNRQLYAALIAGWERFSNPLGRLNALAGRARGQLWSSMDAGTDNAFDDLMGLFQSAGHLTVDNQRVVFPDEKSRQLVQGGWLEHYVFGLVEDLRRKKQLRDAAMGIRVTNNAETSNELDVAFTTNNRLHVIECKTANLRSRESKGDAVVYKLDNLRDLLGGTYGRALLVSYQELRKEDRQRCRANRVSLVCGRKVQNLSDSLPRWVRGDNLQ